MKILSNLFGICMYFPSPIGIRGAIYIYIHYLAGEWSERTKKEDTVEIEKKARPPFINSKKKKKIEERKEKREKREEKREKRNSWFHTMPTYLPVQYLPVRYLVFVSCLGFHTSLLPTDTDRSRPIFCLWLALTYMDLLSRTVLSVELDEIQVRIQTLLCRMWGEKILLSLSSSDSSFSLEVYKIFLLIRFPPLLAYRLKKRKKKDCGGRIVVCFVLTSLVSSSLPLLLFSSLLSPSSLLSFLHRAEVYIRTYTCRVHP